MKFFKQTKPGSCNIIALQHVLSFFNVYPVFDEIDAELPKHEFGSWFAELGIYLENKGIKTKIISNSQKFTSTNKPRIESIEKYKKIGTFEDRFPTEDDVNEMPVLVDVDAFKIKKKPGGPGSHYVTLLKEKDGLFLYDGNNFDQKIKTTFEEIHKASFDVNKFHEDGMWLFLK
jgi:hypothetical protein